MIWPTKNLHANGVIPSWAKFGARGTHTGIDIGHRYGQNIVAADTGVVSWVGDMKAGGWSVRITHADGMESRYLHLLHSSIKVKKGDSVNAGDLIAKVGNSGLEYAYPAEKLKVASHLHFEVLKNGKKIDPELVLGLESTALVGVLATMGLVLLMAYA